ncbi:MAG: hypothetical protein JJT94_06035 [Bernardetiaceae bacterium]|nr:hypothetical protein [Bernardetiaceae bacterium]
MRTVEELQNALNEESSWRKKELSFFLQLIKQRQKEKRGIKNAHSYLLRAAFSNLYAHWEGFVKQSTLNYLLFVAAQNYLLKELTPNFTAICYKEKLKTQTSHKRVKPFINLIEETEGLTFEKRFAANSGVDRTSNLKFDVLQDILQAIGLDMPDDIIMRRQQLEQLLVIRNKVVHGSRLYPSFEEYQEIQITIINLIERLKNDILNQAFEKKYSIEPPSHYSNIG